MNSIAALLGNTDIYLIDQIMKGRYQDGHKILDAGCGSGRNLHWLLQQPGIDCYACDTSAQALQNLQQQYPQIPAENICRVAVEQLPYSDYFFDHVICSAVLHFASDEEHFLSMMKQLTRVLKPGGSLFVRMAAIMGLEDKVIPLGNGRYHLPDDSDRFLLTPLLLETIANTLPLTLEDTIKTTNVGNLRCMSTLIFIKEG